jgi:large subunit ribosomal protein L24
MQTLHVKKGDKVKVISGKDKNKEGVIVRALPSKGQVVVEGVNMFKKHKRAQKQGQKGSIVEVAMPIFVNKVKKI